MNSISIRPRIAAALKPRFDTAFLQMVEEWDLVSISRFQKHLQRFCSRSPTSLLRQHLVMETTN
jgi:hypothetical protein